MGSVNIIPESYKKWGGIFGDFTIEGSRVLFAHPLPLPPLPFQGEGGNPCPVPFLPQGDRDRGAKTLPRPYRRGYLLVFCLH
jgi:hypothetical protein